MLVCVGLDHRDAPVAVRERLRFTPPASREWLSVARLHGVAEGVLLSTCNRTETYVVCADDAWPVIEAWLSADWARRAGRRSEALLPAVRVRMGDDAVRHLFRVAAGLESVLVGEGEILAQVKEAYALSRACQGVGPRLNTLFQAALAAGREARRVTGLGRHALSAGAAVVTLAEQCLGPLRGRVAWVWGSGMIARPTIEHLRACGAEVVVTSRTGAHARDAAGEGGVTVPWADRERALADADVLVCAIDGDEPSLRLGAVQRALALRPARPLFVFDFGVPRTTEAGVAELAGVMWRGVDDLQALVAHNRSLREEASGAAAVIVDRAANEYVRSHRQRQAAPLIRSLYSKAEAVRQGELERTLRRLPDLDESERRAIDHLTQRIVRRLLNDPAIALRSGAAGTDARTLLRTAASLFGLDRGDGAEEG